MKSTVFIATWLLPFSIFFSSCHRYEENDFNAINPLPGHWKLDSILIGKDTSLAYILTSIAMHEPAGISFRFAADSVFTGSQDDITAAHYKFSAPNILTTNENFKEQIYFYTKLNDSVSLLKTEGGDGFFIRRR